MEAKDIIALQNYVDALEKEKVETLAKCFEEGGELDIAKSVREKGLPKQIICGSDLFESAHKLLSFYAPVIEASFVDDSRIILSWQPKWIIEYPSPLTIQTKWTNF